MYVLEGLVARPKINHKENIENIIINKNVKLRNRLK
jgi:hypothetical protein